MQQIVVPVHPLTRRVLLAEYGSEPIAVHGHDILFSMLTHTRLRERLDKHRVKTTLTTAITIEVHDALACHIAARWQQIGLHLFRWHKDQMCRHAATVLRLGGYARPALADWLRLHDVDEEEYSLETAYKLWQRFGWNFSGKKQVFFARNLDKPGVGVGKKEKPKTPAPELLPDNLIAASADRLTDVAAACLRQVPRSLRKHAHLYYYTTANALSQRAVAKRLKMRRESVRYACRSIRNWRDSDPTFAGLLAGCAPNAWVQS